jgi:hypothetical protein
MTYVYIHVFTDDDCYVGISNNPEKYFKEGFDCNSDNQYNYKVLLAKEKYGANSMIISDNLPYEIAKFIESKLINEYEETFNLNIKENKPIELEDIDIDYYFDYPLAYVYPIIDGEAMYNKDYIPKKKQYWILFEYKRCYNCNGEGVIKSKDKYKECPICNGKGILEPIPKKEKYETDDKELTDMLKDKKKSLQMNSSTLKKKTLLMK